MDPGARDHRSAPPTRADPATGQALTRACGAVALAGVAVFAVVCTAAQFLRTDYRWLGMPLSFYAIGPYGTAVQAAFVMLAIGLTALGWGGYRALDPLARSAAPLLLFLVAAAALTATAIAVTDVPKYPPTLHGYVHVAAAATTFLCVTVAMLLQAWRMRLDERWRPRFRPAFALAAAAFAALWIDVLAKPVPRGFGEKFVIALILVWLWRAAWWLAWPRRPPG